MSIKIQLHNQKAEKIGDVQVSEKIFKVELNEDLIHQAYVRQISNERQVLAHTKTKGEVRGGGKKPWRQKGTGRARAGSSRSPIWIGGGVTFGPLKTRNFAKQINRKMRQKAIYMALSDRLNNEKLFLLDEFEVKDFKTKEIDKVLVKFEKVLKDEKDAKRSLLVVNDSKDEKLKYSCRNLEGVKMINIQNINLKDLLKYRNLVLTKKCVDVLSGEDKTKEDKKDTK